MGVNMLPQALLLFAGLVLAKSFELSFLEEVDPAIVKECQRRSDLCTTKLKEFERNSKGCTNAFETSDMGRCYHMCIVRQLGYVLPDGNANQTKLQELYFWLKPDFINAIWSACFDEFNESTDACWGYYVHKCLSENVGIYPLRTMQVPIFNVSISTAKECQADYKISDRELCFYQSDTRQDQFGIIEKARCYHVCMLRKKGLINVNGFDVDALVRRFFYLPEADVRGIFVRCSTGVAARNLQGCCQSFYEIYKCVKRETGEFPVPPSVYQNV